MLVDNLPSCALMHIRADWLEYASSMALPRWVDITHPCFRCWSTRDQLTSIGSFSCLSGPQRSKSAMDYEQACLAAEKWVTIPNEGILKRLSNILICNHRRGHLGRTLQEDLRELGLIKFDCLEMSINLLDIGDFEKLTTPCRVLFWRPNDRSMANRRCPLFIPEIGISLEICTIDPMHTLNLGVYKDFCQAAIGEMLVADIFGIGGGGVLINWAQGCISLRSALTAWYKEKKKRLRKDEWVYEIQDLKPSMLGTHLKPCLAIKAAECATFLEFVTDQLLLCSGSLPHGEALLALGQALVSFRDQMRWEPRTFSVPQLQRFTDTAARAFSLREPAGVPWVPKWHMFLHIAADAGRLGNPQYWTTFLDESFNGHVSKIAGSLHRATWYVRLLGAFRTLYSGSSQGSSSKKPRVV